MLYGVPVSEASSAAFWISFWAGVWSGIVGGLFTGIIVGLVVWWAQTTTDTRRARRDQERELALCRAKLRTALDHSNVLALGGARQCTTRQIDETMKVLDNAPIDLWAEQLPGQKSFIDLLRNARHTYSSLAVAADNLDQRLLQLLRRAAGPFRLDTDRATIEYIMARVHQVKLEEGSRGQIAGAAEMMAATYSGVNADERFQALARSYVKAWGDVARGGQQLKEALA